MRSGRLKAGGTRPEPDPAAGPPVASPDVRAWIFRHLRRHRPLLLLFTVTAVAANLCSTLVPLQVGTAFAEATGSSPDLAAVAGAAVAVGLLAAGRFAADLLSSGSMEIVAQRVKRDARDDLYRSLLAKRLSFHDQQRIGDILARAINDARLVDYMLSPGVATAFNGVLALLVPILFIASLHTQLLLAPGVMVVVFAFALRHHLRRLHPLTMRARERFADLNERFSTTLAGISTVKAATQEEHERRAFTAAAAAYRDAYVRRGQAQAVYLPALSFALAMAVGAVHSLHLYDRGDLTLAQVVTYLGWLLLFAQPVTMSEQAVPVIQEGFVAAARMQQITGGDPGEREDTRGTSAPVEGAITFDRVSFRYDGKEVLRDVSFHVPAGRTLAVVGPTGSGKSTLTKLVNRMYDATGGRVLIDGRDVRDWEPGALRRQIGHVDQETFLFSKSVLDNIAFGAPDGAGYEDVLRAAKQACADDFVQAMEHGYDTVLNEGGTTLSGGQRQRLAIARALLTDPRILTLDDATSAVDAQTETAIAEAIDRVTAGRTTVLISHRPGRIRRADMILLLDAGRVVDLGTHEELIGRCALYREIYSE
ncbi:ATP-binding cassette subfamily B protein [Streptosporangium becharense]|uniref:ATP-binding cassette subfamily B protein n=1 Tax=Streptosporangium becharense TaxID=1816182 RepID=A0A7W9IKN9_9ACTN|nr:ABC transporter ATP-binding protein [Streptosporangium becharense]MBB2911683.1 ATP-binding cassette subfamily B protein [Streptosporangium becharense]MBB5822499.1 ATP-binding cassette subfamily B protein [Streptosporangium becharense]